MTTLCNFLNANPVNDQTHSNTQQPKNFVSVFYHFVGLVLQVCYYFLENKTVKLSERTWNKSFNIKLRQDITGWNFLTDVFCLCRHSFCYYIQSIWFLLGVFFLVELYSFFFYPSVHNILLFITASFTSLILFNSE